MNHYFLKLVGQTAQFLIAYFDHKKINTNMLDAKFKKLFSLKSEGNFHVNKF